MLKQPQYFEQVGKDKYIPVYPPFKALPRYQWDDETNQIIPVSINRISEAESEPRSLENIGYIN